MGLPTLFFVERGNMFNFFNKNKNSDGVMMSPVNGLCIDLSEVPDKVFSERMIGDGVAFIYEDDMICSPCNGTVVMVADTSHAIGIKSGEIEIIIHIGLDTVELNGEGIKVFVKTDQKVKVGTPLVRIDRNFMKEKSVNLTTPMIITNTGDFKLEFKNTGKEVERSKSEVIKYTKSEYINIKIIYFKKKGGDFFVRITKKINNNVALGVDPKGKEVVIFGKGIGFHEIPYELNDLSLISKTFYDIDPGYLELLSEIPEDIFNVSSKIVDYARSKVGCELNPSLAFMLADHINFGVIRLKKSIDITYGFL